MERVCRLRQTGTKIKRLIEVRRVDHVRHMEARIASPEVPDLYHKCSYFDELQYKSREMKETI
jgi:hypothetical protein